MLLKRFATIMGGAMTSMVDLLPSPFFSFCLVLLVSLGFVMGLMAVEDTPKEIESVLDEEDLARIQEEFTILVSIKLKLLGPFGANIRETKRKSSKLQPIWIEKVAYWSPKVVI